MPTKKVLQLHERLSERESALLVQLRTEMIGLNDFLFKRHVPETGLCEWEAVFSFHDAAYISEMRHSGSVDKQSECQETNMQLSLKVYCQEPLPVTGICSLSPEYAACHRNL